MSFLGDHKMLRYTSHMEEYNPLVSVILPAYNEGAIIDRVIQRIIKTLEGGKLSYEILVIDDNSDDNTGLIAQQAGARVITHPYNIGNGASVKTGIRNARGEILIIMDADGQHPPEAIPLLLEKIGPYDMAVGARTSSSESAFHRNIANKIYNALATYVSGRKIEDLTSGFRAVKSPIARSFVYLLPNQFSYPTTITLAILRSGRSLAYIPFEAKRRIGKSKIKPLRDGIRFFLIILRIATFYSPLKVFIPVSIFTFLLGFGYGLIKVLALNQPYGPTSAMLMTMSLVIFMVGLVSEQVAQMRFEGSEFSNMN